MVFSLVSLLSEWEPSKELQCCQEINLPGNWNHPHASWNYRRVEQHISKNRNRFVTLLACLTLQRTAIHSEASLLLRPQRCPRAFGSITPLYSKCRSQNQVLLKSPEKKTNCIFPKIHRAQPSWATLRKCHTHMRSHPFHLFRQPIET